MTPRQRTYSPRFSRGLGALLTAFGLAFGLPTAFSLKDADEIRSATAEVGRVEIRRNRRARDVVITTTSGERLLLMCSRVCEGRGAAAIAEVATSSGTITYWVRENDSGDGSALNVMGFEMGGISVDPSVGLRRFKFDMGGTAVISLGFAVLGAAMMLGVGLGSKGPKDTT